MLLTLFTNIIAYINSYYLWSAGLFAAILIVLVAACGVLKPWLVKYHYQFRFLLVYFAISGASFILWPIYALRPTHPINLRITNKFIQWVVSGLNIKIEVQGEQNLKHDQGAVICMNHQSALDIHMILFLTSFAKRFRPIAKIELLYMMPMGFYFYLAGVKFINRSSPKAAYRTLATMSDEMKNKGNQYVIFPEGTRNSGPGMLPFKKGAFKTAIHAQVPIIPVVVSPYYFIDHMGKTFSEGKVLLKALQPIPTKGMSDVDTDRLLKVTRDVMLTEYERLGIELRNKDN